MATFGRGIWTLPQASNYLGVETPVFIVHNSLSSADTVRLVVDPFNSNLLDIYQNNTSSTPNAVLSLSNISAVIVEGLNQPENLIIDNSNGTVHVPNGISFYGGSISSPGGTNYATLTVTDTNTNSLDTLTENGSSISWKLASSSVTGTAFLDNVGTVDLNGSGGGSTFNALATSSGVATDFVAGGNSTINVGNNGSVQGILGALNLENPPAYNTINVNDANDTVSRTMTLSTLGTNPIDSQHNGDPWGQILGLAPAVINYEYFDTRSLTIDGYADLIVAQGAGGQGWVKIFEGKDGSLLAQFQPYGSSFTDGVRLAAAPVTSNGHVDVVTGEGPGGSPLVDVFDGRSLLAGSDTPIASFDAFARSFTGGVYVATGLISGQGKPPAEIVVGAGAGGEPRVSVFDGAGTQLQSFLAFDPGFHGGVRVATADVTGNGRSEIIAAQGPGPGSLPQVRAFDGVSLAEVDQFFAFAADDAHGMFVAGGGRWGLFHEVSQTGAHPPVEQKSSANEVSDAANSSSRAVTLTSTDPPQAPATSPMASYVASAFEDVLRRAPDDSALAYWSGQLAGALSPGEFAADLTHSAEFYATNVITPAYQQYLSRAADAAGIAYWTSRMQQGMTDQQIEAQFIASPEFYAHAGGTNSGWVNALYQVVLGRPGDSVGMSYWLAQLSAGASRSTIALGFAAGREREARMIQDDYFNYLGRDAAASEVNYWLAQFDEGATNEDILSGFIGSGEYVQSHSD